MLSSKLPNFIVWLFLTVGIVALLIHYGCAPTAEEIHRMIHEEHMKSGHAHNPYKEPKGYAQPDPNPLEGDKFDHKPPRDIPTGREFFKEPIPLEEDNPILRCAENIVYVKAVQIGREILPNGLFVRLVVATTDTGYTQYIAAMYPILNIDRNKDGTIDVNVTDYPVMYQVDLDNDRNHKPEVIYVDKGGEGKCDDIKLYKDLRTREYTPKEQA